eukprot:XP_024450130.1 DEAD-box ATP-dependent RNA helicase 28 [Populus trichocarpa]
MIFLFQFNFQDFILSNTSLRLVSPTNQTVCTLACSSHRLGSGNEVMSAQQAEDLKMKEKRKREREKDLPCKKRRKLQAGREMLEDEDLTEKPEGSGKNKKENTGLSLVDLGYRRVKAAGAVKKALDAGKIVQKKAGKKSKPPPERTQSRTEEMRELFQRDMSERKQKRMEQETGSPRIHLRANQGISGGGPIKFAIKLCGHLPR